MSDARTVDETGQAAWFRRGLNAVGIVVVGWDVISRFARSQSPGWAFVAAMIALVAWAVFVIVPARHLRVIVACLAFLVVGGALSTTAIDGVGIVPIVIAILWLARDPLRPLGFALVAGIIALALVLVGNLIVPLPPLALLSIGAGIALAFFAGVSRRQFTISAARSRALAGQQARADVLASRQQIAHDIHDVLAHSLGGLVIQLDAVDALLEAGEPEAAAARIRDARTLAADGLAEARRAVAALGEVPAEGRTDPSELLEALTALLVAHRSLGGAVGFDETGARVPVDSALATALRRALQEGLTNARKHAPGEPVEVRLEWNSETVTLRIRNPVGAHAAVAGTANRGTADGGHGLVGMRDRFAKLAGGSATAVVESGTFVVSVAGRTA